MIQSLVVLLGIIFSANSVAVRDRYFHSNKYITYSGLWGSWGSWEYCDGDYAVSFSQRVEGNQGGDDDTALNAICLKCNSGRTICSKAGGWGGWASSSRCSAGYKGADFKFERNQGGGDDTAANGLELVCASGGSHMTSNMGPWGSWKGYQYCNSGQRICGIQTRVERHQGSGRNEDDTALNGVDLRCCGKVSSVSVRLVKIFSRSGNGTPDPEGSKYQKQITSSTGLVYSSGYYSSSTIMDVAWRVQSVAGYSGAVSSITSNQHLAELVKVVLMSPLNNRHSSSSTSLKIPVNVHVDVYAYVGETTVTMSDGSQFKFRGSEVVKNTQSLSTTSRAVTF